MTKTFETVEGMIDGLSSRESFKKEAQKRIKNRTVAKFLFALRCEHNLTQAQLAKKIGCSQSKISKIEGSLDSQITLKDLLDYSKALNLQLEVGYRNKNAKIMDLIKYHAFQMKGCLDRLVDLAGEDESIAIGVLDAHFETLVSTTRLVLENVPGLQKGAKKRTSKEAVYISPPLEDKLKSIAGELVEA